MLSLKDRLALGMMIFALFLGAGNIIFPPMEGYLAGSNWLVSAFGFALTGVVMPFVTLVVVAQIGRGEVLTRDLPKPAQVAFWVTLYLVIGSTFAMPRVTNVAYEMAWVPLNVAVPSALNHFAFAAAFNLVGMFFMLKRTSILTTVGKYMTPALLALLVVVAIGVIAAPLSEIGAPKASHADGKAFSAGLIGGYQTMDVLAATAFGGIVAQALRAKGVRDKKHVLRHTLMAGSISVLLLTLLYFSLFYLGATGHKVAVDATNGGRIFSRYIDALFGDFGVWIMSGIVILANLTTLVGVTTACADYFSRFHSRLGYPFWVGVFTAATIVISNVGLDTLLRITVPALLLIYPITITLVALQLARLRLPLARSSYLAVVFVAFVFGLIDAANHLELIPDALAARFAILPLYDNGLAWLLPTFAAAVFGVLYTKTRA